MNSNLILREESAYRRGMVLGLTVAEILVLVLFVLLLLLAALLTRRQTDVDSLRDRESELVQMLAAEAGRRSTSEQALVEFQRQVQAATGRTADLTDTFKELVTLREQARSADLQLSELQEKVDDLDRERDLLRSRLAELTAQLERSLPMLEASDPAESISAERKLAATDDLLRVLGVSPTDDDAAGTLDYLAEALAGAVERSPALTEPKVLVDAIGQIGALERERQDLTARVALLAQQIEAAGRGIDWPPCWTNAQQRPEYLFDITMRDGGLVLAVTDLPHRADDRASLPFGATILGQTVSRSTFQTATAALYRHSIEKNCRFYVRVLDATSDDMSVNDYRAMRQTIENHFYIWLSRRG